jgi:molecular chaperone GrpE
VSDPHDDNLEGDKDIPLHQHSDDVSADLDPEATLTLSEAERRQLELLDANNRALRAQADLDNYRKRVQREQQQESKYALMPLLRDLLPLLDNIQRAIEAAEKNKDTESILEGFKLVAQQLQSILVQHHCQPIAALGKTFDPNLHEAVSQAASDEHEAGKVVLEVAVGYQLQDRVVRPSQVIVSSGPSE